jgi:hypothetical protein
MEVTNSRPRAKRRHAPDDDIDFYFLLRVTNYFFSLCGCSRVQIFPLWRGGNHSTPEGQMVSKGNKLHDYHTYNIGVHSCSATSGWLYDGPHTGFLFVLQYYHLRRGCVGTLELWAVQDTHHTSSHTTHPPIPLSDLVVGNQVCCSDTHVVLGTIAV